MSPAQCCAVGSGNANHAADAVFTAFLSRLDRLAMRNHGRMHFQAF